MSEGTVSCDKSYMKKSQERPQTWILFVENVQYRQIHRKYISLGLVWKIKDC